jgi:hypothetical protein
VCKAVDGQLTVPVIRSRNKYRINVLAFEQSPIIGEAWSPGERNCAIQSLLIDIANRRDAGVLRGAALHEGTQMPRTHATDADTAETDPIVRAKRLR